MEFGVLGRLTVVRDGAEVELTAKQRALLAVLLSRAGRRVPDGVLADAVWGAARPSGSTVRWHVHQVRQRLGGDRISRDGDGYLLAVEPHELDALRFEELCSRAAPAAAAGDHRAAARLYGEALACWRGDAYEGLDALREEAARLERSRVSAREGRAEALIALDRPSEAAAELAALVAAHPLDERLRALHLLALHRSGRRAEALTAYHEGRELLVAELGLEPGHHLRAAHARVLGDEERAVATTPRQLPPGVTAFTGRARELAALDRCAGDGAVALVVGPGGVGKTGLAVHWAHTRAARYPDGQLYADLRGRTRPLPPEEVLGRFLRALGAGGVPGSLEERAALYRTLLRERRMLVLLDDAAGAAQVRPLLPGSAGCGVVVTGRGALDGLVAGQGARPVPLGELPPGEAAELIGRVAGGPAGVRGGPAELAELARLCDGLPLALRIAGARLATRPGWTAAGLAARLRRECGRLDELRAGDLDVRAGLAPGHGALGERERLLFGLLGLLPPLADFAPWTAAALLGVPVGEAARLLDRLADAQLVRHRRVDAAGQERYRLPDLTRLYAAERAAADVPEDERRAAVPRTLAALLALAGEALRRVSPGGRPPGRDRAPLWQAGPGEVEALLGGDPLGWLRCERGTLARAVPAAAGLGESGLCRDLALAGARLSDLLRHPGPPPPATAPGRRRVAGGAGQDGPAIPGAAVLLADRPADPSGAGRAHEALRRLRA
ncbi:BTAD domain-containing putative transcriptional regulator [Nonomuraea sp. ATR24]|uniref:AfsR/SARP family transcriptional regulator n=1 Tax=Nonomuraea sp. ATR24 TaxID=1676744 RepID=UPI0035BF23AB